MPKSLASIEVCGGCFKTQIVDLGMLLGTENGQLRDHTKVLGVHWGIFGFKTIFHDLYLLTVTLDLDLAKQRRIIFSSLLIDTPYKTWYGECLERTSV